MPRSIWQADCTPIRRSELHTHLSHSMRRPPTLRVHRSTPTPSPSTKTTHSTGLPPSKFTEISWTPLALGSTAQQAQHNTHPQNQAGTTLIPHISSERSRDHLHPTYLHDDRDSRAGYVPLAPPRQNARQNTRHTTLTEISWTTLALGYSPSEPSRGHPHSTYLLRTKQGPPSSHISP